MPSLRSLIDPGGRSLVYHIDRLHRTLDDLTERLRNVVSQAVGETVAGVVQDMLHAALNLRATDYASDSMPRRQYGRRRPLWDSPDPLRDEYGWEEMAEEEIEPLSSHTTALHGATLVTWPAAVAVGLKTAAWWLQRRSGRFRLLAAIGAGGTATLIVLAGESIAVAGAELAASVLGLAGLEALMHSTTAALDTFTGR